MKRKHNQIHINDGDIQTMIFSLSVIPRLNYEDTAERAEMNTLVVESAIRKLSNIDMNLSSAELRMVAIALHAVSSVCYGAITVSDELKKECMPYLFSINKLIPHFPIPR